MVLLCSFILVGHTHAQQVIVARETKPEAPKQAAPPPEQTPAESATPAQVEHPKPKSRSKRSTSAEPTLEEMRMAGALAAERLNSPSPSQTRRSGRSDSEAAVPTPSPAVPETPKPARRETRSEQTSTSRRPGSRVTKPDASGAVRPTFMQSGREQPSATPSSKEQTPVP
jgi:hypothetical protein